jgi:hypothetical protein
LLLVGEEVSFASQESENSVEKSIDIALLLDDSHQNAIKFVLLVHALILNVLKIYNFDLIQINKYRAIRKDFCSRMFFLRIFFIIF